ncbi:MAG: PH domain-containing protein [Bacteroidota bacterium]
MKTNLRQNEKIAIKLRKHWFVLLSPIFWTILLLALAVFGYYSKPEFSVLFIIGGVFTLLWFAYKIIDRRNNIWVVTNFRVIDEAGVFSIHTKESPLDKINNVSSRQPFWGRIFGYGDVEIQTAAEMGATIHKMVEKPKLLKETITTYQEKFKQFELQEQAKNLAHVVENNSSKPSSGLSDELTKLHQLKTKGVITEAEFNRIKARILSK